jgi:Tfp pilus assembly protein PilF
MSLILDSLKKINSSKKTGSAVPPSLLNLKPAGRKQGPKKSLLVLLAVALVGFLIVLFMPTGEKYTINAAAPIAVQPQPQTQAQAPEQESAAVPVPEPAHPIPVQQAAPIEQEPQTPARTAPEFDPTAANKQRLAAMVGLPEINSPAPTQQPTAAPAIPVQQQEQAPQQTAPAQPQQAIESNPSFVLTGRAKRDYDAKVQYNTLTSQAASALRTGNNRKAEDFYTKALAEKVTKPSLTGLLTAKIRQGKLNEVQGVINNNPYSADAAVISAAALEMSSLGYNTQALDLLSDNASKTGNGELYYTAGIIQENAGNFSKAETAYQKAVKSVPGDSYFLYAYARILDVQQKYDEAVKNYTRIAEMPSADDKLRTNAKDRAQAIEAYLSALSTQSK